MKTKFIDGWIVILLGAILLLLCACEKQPEMKCCQCEDVIQPSNYVPGYCATVEMVDAYKVFMEGVKYGGKYRYKCEDVK